MVDNILDQKIMIYHNSKDTIGKKITLRQALEDIGGGKYKQHTDKLRAMPDKKERLHYKVNNLSAYIFQGTFKERSKKGLINGIGILLADIDIYEKEKIKQIRASIIKLPYVAFAFLSPSGGLKIGIKIPIVSDDEEYKKYYKMVEYLFRVFNIKTDKSTKDVCRLCFVSHDPEIYINEKAIDVEMDLSIIEEKTEIPSTYTHDSITPIHCIVCEKYISEPGIKSGELTYHSHCDGGMYRYCKDNNKPELLKKYKTSHGREDSAFNDCDNWQFICRSFRKFLIQNKNDMLNRQALIECYECQNCNIKKTISNTTEDPELEIEILKKPQNIDFEPTIKICEGFTSHLPLYDLMNREMGIQGEGYDTLKKLCLYKYNSLIQPSIRVEITPTIASDNHIHSLVLAPPASGKGLLKNHEKKYCREIQKGYCYEISALSHREQLIGKTVKIKGVKKDIPGIFSALSVIHDECQSVINEEKEQHAEAMRIKRQAMDIYGDNEMSKKLIDNTFDEALSYHSISRVSDYMHPTCLMGIFFESGTFRRYNLIYEAQTDNEISLKDMTKITTNQNIKESSFSDAMIEIYNNVERKIKNYEMNYTPECLGIVSDFHALFLEFCIKHGNRTLLRYALNSTYSLRIHFMRFVNVLHLSKGKKVTDQKITIQACCDVCQMLLVSMKTLNKFANLSINNSTWYGLQVEEIISLEYLLRKNAINESVTNVTIGRFDTILAELYGLKPQQTRAKRHQLKLKGFIDYRQYGKYSSKIWLLKVPEEIRIIEKDYVPEHIIKYVKGVNSFQGTLTPLGSEIWEDEGLFMENLPPLFKGGKGVSKSTMSLKNIHTRKITYFLSFLYNITYMGETLPPLPPLKMGGKLSTDKSQNAKIQSFKGVNHPEKPLTPLNPKKDNAKVKALPNKPNILQSMDALDEGQGIDTDSLFEVMNCNKKDFTQYLEYALQCGDIYECRKGWYKKC